MSKDPEGVLTADRRLLAFVQKKGLVTVEQVADLLSKIPAGATAADTLEAEGVIAEADLARLLAQDLRLPRLNLPALAIEPETVKLVDEAVANRHLVMPTRAEGKILLLAMVNPFDFEIVKQIEFRTGLPVRPAVAVRSQIREAIDRYCRLEANLGEILADVPDAAAAPSARQPTDSELEKSIDDAPVVKMVHLVLGKGMRNRASDIHVEPRPNSSLVRFRINGVLEDAFQIPKWVHSSVVARIKVMSRLDITERRVPQDGGMRIRFDEHVVDLRVSSLPTNYGEKLVMRILDPSIALRRLEEIGLSTRDSAVLRSVIAKPEGMILVTGPTGSGKTTTLYAVVQEILSPDLNVVTIENPIEYEIQGVNQVQINPKQGLTFAGALRSILRQDPDVILVGEIRDRETAQVAFQAAQTGHLVLSTLHTNDSVSTITRLIDLGIEPYLTASSLLAVVAQRLVRTVCPGCAEPLAVDDEVRKTFGLRADAKLQQGRGCRDCRETGFASRLGVFEILEMTPRLQQQIETRVAENAIRVAARKQGMVTLFEDAAVKIEAGLTTPDEALRVVEIQKGGPQCPQCGQALEEGFVVCPECLFRLRQNCPACGAPQETDWKRCPYCGQSLEDPVSAEPATAAPKPVLLEDPLEVDLDAEAPPVSDAEAAPQRAPIPAPVSIDVPRILVVDDQDDLRAMVRRMLERGPVPMRVSEASNGLEALGAIRLEPPHLVILDLMMPRMDGFELCRTLRGDVETAFLPIMMLTAREDTQSRLEGFRAGTDDYLVKPIERGELMGRILRLLERTYGFHAPGKPPAPEPGCAKI